MKNRNRIKEILVGKIQNLLHHADEFVVESRVNTPTGGLIHTMDSVLGQKVYEIRLIERQNLAP